MPEVITDIITSIFSKNARSEKMLDFLEVIKKQSVAKEIKVPFSQLEKWYFDHEQNLRHASGKFFSIQGVRYNFKNNKEEKSVFINQPEVGILGIITKKIDGVLHFLMQLKFEPGNIGVFQLSPTVQATKSNYTTIHNGSLVPYLNYFIPPSDFLFDILLSEQAGRFYKKTNRNTIRMYVEDDVEVLPNFFWLTLGQILSLAKQDNFVNMNTRSIIACIILSNIQKQVSVKYAKEYYDSLNRTPNDSRGKDFFISAHNVPNTYTTLDKIKEWILLKKKYGQITSQLISLNDFKSYNKNDYEIFSGNTPQYKVIALNVFANREVSAWSQPIISDCYIRIHGFLTKKIEGVLHFLIKAHEEIGNINGAEIGPTIQGIPLSEISSSKDDFVKYFISPPAKHILVSVMQSDEGGRFYKTQNLHTIVLTEDEFELPDDYKWVTLYQIKELIQIPEYVNLEVRSLVACISFLE